MESIKNNSLIKFDLECETPNSSDNKDNIIYKIDGSKCGEIIFSYSGNGHFQLKCNFCEQTYFKIKLFAKHFLKDHLYCHEEHSINYLINDSLEIDFKDKNDSFCANENSEVLSTCNTPKSIKNDIIESESVASEIETKGEENSSDDELLIEKTYKNRKKKVTDKFEPYECSICNAKFIRKYNLTQHIINKHKNKDVIKNNIDKEKSSNIVKTAVKKDIKKIICYICGKETSKSDMRQHLKSHDNNRYTHKCNDCEKLFISQKSLDLHNKNFHINLKPFKCKFENCNKSFVSEHALTAHHRLHSDVRTFKCSICQKGFLYKYKMDHHIKIYHVNGRSYKCDICGKGYYESYTLERHKICHSNDKPFACDECPARFPRERSLAWHKHSHSGIKEFKCKICGKEYALYNGIYSHMKTHGIKYSLAYEKGLAEPEKLENKDDIEDLDT